ncbi:Kinesin family member 6 [Paragonimus heterotremus]|uniref:Kinesin-like protein n=1 Tax=Paragonimus heterotremus TaxID=100268 RepID=A0A8J4WG77_9TREM|nr:Kinesin family member 6 [Paragonimus heterotremus]
MVKQTIQIVLRLRPPRRKHIEAKYDVDESSGDKPKINIDVGKALRDNVVCNRRETYRFQFDAIFDTISGQDQIFDTVSKPVVDKVLEGYNGTVFSYGQTGSGKTFTITGGAEKYSDRGIIPRAIAYIFKHFETHLETEFTLKISYLEIYNENGYDLLDARHESATKLEDLPRVTLFEDTEAGTVFLKNLSMHTAVNVDEALNLLFMGDTNRMIAETPMNEASTRSHCIFTMHILARPQGATKLRRSKLHLVDLAGSERVYKSGIDGTILTEAKYINLSLHYLEQVIIALSEKQRTHVPYRNSMMTMVLRDSLGGNCMTSMIANCSIEQDNLLETISTCRFAQRVALIKNDVILNEEQDPRLVISCLKQEVDRLKAELALATGRDCDEELSEEEKESNTIFMFLIPKFCPPQKLHKAALAKSQETVIREIPQPVLPSLPVSTKEASELRDIVTQRDHEIRILVDLLKREKKRQSSNDMGTNEHKHPPNDTQRILDQKIVTSHNSSENGPHQSIDEPRQAVEQVTAWMEQNAMGRLMGSVSVGRSEAFDLFKRDYHLREKIDEQKDELRILYSEAKRLGQHMCEARNEAGHLQTQLSTMMHMEQEADAETIEQIQQIRKSLEIKREAYRSAYTALTELRPRIEHLQHTLETAKLRLVQEFEKWWISQCKGGELSSQNHISQEETTANPSVRGSETTKQLSMNRTSKQNEPFPSSRSRMTLSPSQSTEHATESSTPVRELEHHSKFVSAQFGEIPLTGDPVVDADILTFVRAREKIRRRQMANTEYNKG